MPKMMLALSFGFAVLILATQNAFAAGNCAERSIVLNELGGKYGETRRAMGIAGNDGMMEIFASVDTGTWTLTVTTASGITCLVASGAGYQGLDETVVSLGDPA